MTHDEIFEVMRSLRGEALSDWLRSQPSAVLHRAVEVELAIDALVEGLDPDEAWNHALDQAPLAWLALSLGPDRSAASWRRAVACATVEARKAMDAAPPLAEVVRWERGLPVR